MHLFQASYWLLRGIVLLIEWCLWWSGVKFGVKFGGDLRVEFGVKFGVIFS